MKRLLSCIALALSLFAQTASGQSPNRIAVANERPVPLCCHLDSFGYEFSSLARYGSRVLLVPQCPEATGNFLFALASSSIDSAIGARQEVTNIMRIRFNSMVSDLVPAMDGIEGTVVIGNSVFFTVETKIFDTHNYILKGVLDTLNTSGPSVTLTDQIKIPKRSDSDSNDNAGFESITYLPKLGKLMVIFEKCATKESIYLVDTALSDVQPVTLNAPLLFRVTEACLEDSATNTVLLLNHHFNDLRFKGTEFRYYIGNETAKAKNEMRGLSASDLSFTRIVRLKVNANNTAQWDKAAETLISYSDDNWEGMIYFPRGNEKGVLMIVDGVPPGLPCRLSYFKIK